MLYSLFFEEETIVAMGVNIMRVIGVIVVLQISQVIYMGCLRGAGDAKYMALISMINLAIVRPVMSWALCYPVGLGVIGAWIGLFIDQIMRMAFATMRMRGDKWMSHKV